MRFTVLLDSIPNKHSQRASREEMNKSLSISNRPAQKAFAFYVINFEPIKI